MNTEHFQIEAQSHHVLVNCQNGFANEFSDELIELLGTLNDSFEDHPTPPLLFMRLKENGLLSAAFLNRLVKIATELKKKGQKVFLIGPSPVTVTLLTQRGLNDLLRPAATVEDALAQLNITGPAKPGVPVKMDAAFIRPFVTGTQEVLKKLCQLDVTVQKAYLKKKGKDLEFEVAAAVLVQGARLQATIVMGMRKKTFLEILSRWLGEKFETLENRHLDGVAELLNMIFGHAKTLLNQMATHEIRMCIPKVVRNPTLLRNSAGDHPAVIIPFKSEVGDLWLQLVDLQEADDVDEYLELFSRS